MKTSTTSKGKATRRAPSNRQFLKSEKEYAEQYSCDIRTIRRYKVKGYPLDDPSAMEKIIGAQTTCPPGSQPVDIAEAKLQKILEECRRLRHRNEVEEGKYISRAEVRADLVALIAEASSVWQQVNNDLSPTLAGLSAPEIHEKLEAARNKIMSFIHDGEERSFSR